MKVIKEPKSFTPLRLTCRTCEAEIEADSPDDFRRCTGGNGDLRDSYYDYAQATCPCCGAPIRVDSSKFPPHIYQRLKAA